MPHWETIQALVGDEYGLISVLSDGGNVGILIFLVVLGIMVDLMNKGGGSEAFGRWAKKHVHTRCGAQLLTMLLGVLIFIDDYFNCLTVGAVMRPAHRVAPHLPREAGLPDRRHGRARVYDCPGLLVGRRRLRLRQLRLRQRHPDVHPSDSPGTTTGLLTLLMIVVISVLNIDYGTMLTHEYNAQVKGDLFTTPERPFEGADDYVKARLRQELRARPAPARGRADRGLHHLPYRLRRLL